MGGFGAASLGLRNPDRFGAVLIWDGALHDWTTLTSNRPRIASNQFGDDRSFFERWSPWTGAEEADLASLPILIASGLLVDFADRYERHLRALGADVTRYSTECLHDLRCQTRAVGQEAFAFIDQSLVGQ